LKKKPKKIENPKNPVLGILRFGYPLLTGSLGQLSTGSKPEIRSSELQKTAFPFVISNGFTFCGAFSFSPFYLIAQEIFKKHQKKKFENPKNPISAILQFGYPLHTGGLGQLSGVKTRTSKLKLAGDGFSFF